MKKTVKNVCSPAFAARLLPYMQLWLRYYWGRYVYRLEWVDDTTGWAVCRCLRDDVDRTWTDQDGCTHYAWTPYISYDALLDLADTYGC